jgi:hypothetical protein
VSQKVLIAGFAGEEDLLQAVAAVRERGWPIVEAFTPYPVHGLDRAMGLRRSRLSVACFLSGLTGLALALLFQFWTTAWDWPLNVGGQPWNSLPAFVPVTFEAMVLFAGLGLVLAWLIRSRLYPGKEAALALPEQTDNRFVLVVREPRELGVRSQESGAGGPEAGIQATPEDARAVLQRHGAASLEEREE